MVVHGTADTLIAPSGGERTAEVIPDAELRLIDGMGHDMPPFFWSPVIEAVMAAAARACEPRVARSWVRASGQRRANASSTRSDMIEPRS